MCEETRKTAPLVVGLLGGVASGKSTVARLFGEMGGRVIDADRLAGEVLQGAEGRKAIRKAFGNEVFRADGRVDPDVLSRLVFDDPEKLRRLTAIVHPPVADRIRSTLDGLGRDEIAVLDIPLLVESPFLGDCDLLVFVEAPLAVRKRRVRDVRGWDGGEIARREKHQAPLAEKIENAHLILRNQGNLEDVRREARGVWNKIENWKTKPPKEVEDA